MSGAWAELSVAGTPQTLDPGVERHRPGQRPWGRGGVQTLERSCGVRGSDLSRDGRRALETWFCCLPLAFLFGLVGQWGTQKTHM